MNSEKINHSIEEKIILDTILQKKDTHPLTYKYFSNIKNPIEMLKDYLIYPDHNGNFSKEGNPKDLFSLKIIEGSSTIEELDAMEQFSKIKIEGLMLDNLGIGIIKGDGEFISKNIPISLDFIKTYIGGTLRTSRIKYTLNDTDIDNFKLDGKWEWIERDKKGDLMFYTSTNISEQNHNEIYFKIMYDNALKNNYKRRNGILTK